MDSCPRPHSKTPRVQPPAGTFHRFTRTRDYQICRVDVKCTAHLDEVDLDLINRLICTRNRLCAPHTVRAPKANAIAERFVHTARAECLDWLLIVNRRHLERVLRVFVNHYNSHRPHRALNLAPPDPPARKLRVARPPAAGVERRDRLGGLVREYSLTA